MRTEPDTAVRIDITRYDKSVHFQVSGDIDENGASEMKRRFGQLDLGKVEEVVFNLQDVTYIGSAGLGKLLLFYKKLSTNSTAMKIEHPSAMVRDILVELRLDSLFPIV